MTPQEEQRFDEWWMDWSVKTDILDTVSLADQSELVRTFRACWEAALDAPEATETRVGFVGKSAAWDKVSLEPLKRMQDVYQLVTEYDLHCEQIDDPNMAWLEEHIAELLATRERKVFERGLESARKQCWKDMLRFVENFRKDSEPSVSAYDTLTTMLATLNDVGIEGFGVPEAALRPIPAKEEKRT